MKKVVVTFDIDGTLLWCRNGKKIQMDSIIYAFKQLFPTYSLNNFDRIKKHLYPGITDSTAIKIMLKHSVETDDIQTYKKFIGYYEDYFINQKLDAYAQKNIIKLLNEVNKMDNVQICNATGNTKPVAIHKLKNVGIESYFKPYIGGFGDNETRAGCILDSKKKVEKLFNCKINKIIHIGDTPSDVQEAQIAGAIPIGVCVGQFKKNDFKPTEAMIVDNYETGYDRIYETILSMSKESINS